MKADNFGAQSCHKGKEKCSGGRSEAELSRGGCLCLHIKGEMGDTSVGGREAPLRGESGRVKRTRQLPGGAGPTLERFVPTNARADGGRSRPLLRPPRAGRQAVWSQSGRGGGGA